MRIRHRVCLLLSFFLLLTETVCCEEEYNPVKYISDVIVHDYDETVASGQIRFVSQRLDTADRYGWGRFSNNKSFTYGPATNCTTAVQSMAFSYIGIDATPEVIVEQPTNFRNNYGFEQADTAYRIGSTANSVNLDRFLELFVQDEGEGIVSPVIIHYRSGESNDPVYQHSVLVVGMNEEGWYIAVDPAGEWDDCIRMFTLHKMKGRSYLTGDVTWGDKNVYLDAIEQYNRID